jgi:hypothetical protein
MDLLWDGHDGSPSPNSSQGSPPVSPSKAIIRPEIKEGIIPIIKHLKRQALLIKCFSPYNTPILRVKKEPNKWRLFQDLCLINEAVVLSPL